jgi:hypothetical protein
LPLFYPKAKTTSLVAAPVTITVSQSVTASGNLILFGPLSVAATPCLTPAPNPALLTCPNFLPQAYATSVWSCWMNLLKKPSACSTRIARP